MKLHVAGDMPNYVLDYIFEQKEHSKKIFILQSFMQYYKNSDKLSFFQQETDSFILDSGAFTMLYGSKAKINLDTYISKYVDAINYNNITNYIELDLYSIIGIKETESIRNQLEQRTQRKSIPVFHRSLGIEYYKKLINNYDYIALGGIAIAGRGGYTISILKKMLSMAEECDCKVHGLGMTDIKKLKYLPFYSVDSTSWLAPLRYGVGVHYFNNGKFEVYNKPKGMKMKIKPTMNHQIKVWVEIMQYMYQEKNKRA